MHCFVHPYIDKPIKLPPAAQSNSSDASGGHPDLSFTMVVELPGEANPLSLPNVLNALVLAASSTQQQVQTGTKQLQHWEKQEKYHSYLQVGGIPVDMVHRQTSGSPTHVPRMSF